METKVISTIKGHARVDVADVLRGLAVMGIIILHSIEHFNFFFISEIVLNCLFLRNNYFRQLN